MYEAVDENDWEWRELYPGGCEAGRYDIDGYGRPIGDPARFMTCSNVKVTLESYQHQ